MTTTGTASGSLAVRMPDAPVTERPARQLSGWLALFVGAAPLAAGIAVQSTAQGAQAMLRRQQADAVVAARQRLVQGAVGMVRQALESLDEQNIVDLDEERKAAMISNLLVVLCSDHSAQPVVNAGTLYQ